MSLGNMLVASAARHSEKSALICRDQVVSYGELDWRSRELALWFLREGLHPGDRVAIHWPNEFAAVELLLACLHAGLIAVPINVRLKPPEIGYILEHCRPAMCFSAPGLAPLVESARAGHPNFPEPRPSLPSIRREPHLPDLPPVNPDQPAAIFYTSGTTARPKGVIHTHETLLAAAHTMWPGGINDEATLLVAVPVMHASGLIATTLPGLLAGSTMVLIPVFSPAAALDAIERHGCTLTLVLPAMMQFIASEQERQPRNVRSLRDILGGGDAVPLSLQEHVQRLFGISLLEGFAMTESVVIACNRRGNLRAGSIGQTAHGVEARVVDINGNPLPDGQTGELAVRSPANFIGYWNAPEATAATLVDGWLMTGDLVRRDGDGFLWFQGRKKEIIIRGGSNISPQEVEEALYMHPSVFEAGVIGLSDPIHGEEVVACVSLRKGESVTSNCLIEFVRQHLADYKVPSRIIFLPELPKGITGKVHRKSLKEIVQSSQANARP